MNWTEILANAGIPEPPGREQAIADAQAITAARYAKTGGPKRARGNASRPVKQVSRKLLQQRERRARFTSLKHSAQD